MVLRAPVSRMYEIGNFTRAITPETAWRLAQSDYDLEKAQEDSKSVSNAKFSREAAPLESY